MPRDLEYSRGLYCSLRNVEVLRGRYFAKGSGVFLIVCRTQHLATLGLGQHGKLF